MSLDHLDRVDRKNWAPVWLFEQPEPEPEPPTSPPTASMPPVAVSDPPEAAPPVLGHPEPLPWRPVLAGWPVAWRERWGRRANELEDTGLGWRDAESRAFEEMTGDE